MDSLLHLSEDALGGPGVAVGLIDLDASRSTNKPDCPLSPEDVFGSVDHLLSIDAGTHHSGWPEASEPMWGTAMPPKTSHDYAPPLQPAHPTYYRTASWPATLVPQPPMLSAMSVPPPPLSPNCDFAHRRASLPIMGDPLASPGAPLDGSVHNSDVHSFLQHSGDDGSTHSRRHAGTSSDADTPSKMPLSNIAAMMTGINMGVAKEAGKSAKGPLKDPPRSRSSIGKSAKERMLQQNRMAQAKYRERQKERALQMASELATKRQQNVALMAAVEDRDATIAMLRSQLASAEAGLGDSAPETNHARGTLIGALVQVRGLLDKERLWVPTEASGGLGTAPSGLHVLLQGIEPPATDVTKTVNVAVEAYVQFCHHRIIQAMQPLARSLLLDSWRGLLHQLQLTASQHTMVSNLARNTLTRLRTLQLRRAHLAQDLHAACLTALATSHGDKTHVSVNGHGDGSLQSLLLLDNLAMPVPPALEPLAMQLLQAMEATWAEQAHVVHESNDLLLRHVLSTLQSARLLVMGYPDKCDAVQLGLVLLALPGPGPGPGPGPVKAEAG